MTDEQASLAKAFSTVRMRETVGWARELMGGNGILLEHNVGRYVADAEAIYSYEGTREVNTLIVAGRSPARRHRLTSGASQPRPSHHRAAACGRGQAVHLHRPVSWTRSAVVSRALTSSSAVRSPSPSVGPRRTAPAGRRSRAAAGPGRPAAASPVPRPAGRRSSRAAHVDLPGEQRLDRRRARRHAAHLAEPQPVDVPQPGQAQRPVRALGRPAEGQAAAPAAPGRESSVDPVLRRRTRS